MKNLLKILLSAIFLFGAVPTVNAMDMKMENSEEIKKKKKKKKKKESSSEEDSSEEDDSDSS